MQLGTGSPDQLISLKGLIVKEVPPAVPNSVATHPQPVQSRFAVAIAPYLHHHSRGEKFCRQIRKGGSREEHSKGHTDDCWENDWYYCLLTVLVKNSRVGATLKSDSNNKMDFQKWVTRLLNSLLKGCCDCQKYVAQKETGQAHENWVRTNSKEGTSGLRGP